MTRVLVDTSVWIDHLHRRDEQLVPLLEQNLVVTHPMVVGELALGSIRRRDDVLGLLRALPRAPEARDTEILELIDRRELMGRGLGLVDVHLLASVLIGADLRLLTRDKRLDAAASELSVRW